MNLQNMYLIYYPVDENSWLAYSRVANAAQNLTGTAFKLYIYLCAQEQDMEELFRPMLFLQDFGVSSSSAHRAFKELIEKGYLIADGNRYVFSRVGSK